jgi:hypothetical protein
MPRGLVLFGCRYVENSLKRNLRFFDLYQCGFLTTLLTGQFASSRTFGTWGNSSESRPIPRCRSSRRRRTSPTPRKRARGTHRKRLMWAALPEQGLDKQPTFGVGECFPEFLLVAMGKDVSQHDAELQPTVLQRQGWNINHHHLHPNAPTYARMHPLGLPWGDLHCGERRPDDDGPHRRHASFEPSRRAGVQSVVRLGSLSRQSFSLQPF